MPILDSLIIAVSVLVCALLTATILLIRADTRRRDRAWREYKLAQERRWQWAEVLQAMDEREAP